VSESTKLESGDSYLVTDSAFTNRIYLIVGERKGANSPKGNAALAQLNKAEVSSLLWALQEAYERME
jgi:hypothetical protein